MTLSEYKTMFYKKWQKRITRYCWIVIIVHLLATTGLNIGLFLGKVFTVSQLWEHTFYRSVLPSIIQMSILIPSTIFVFKFNSTTNIKNRVVAANFFWIMTVAAFFQSTYSLFQILPAITMFLTALSIDKTLLKVNFAASLLLLPFTLSAGAIFFSGGFSSAHIVAFVSLIAIIVLIYFICLEIIKFQEALISYMTLNYQKQEVLSEEIQIEPLTQLYNRTALSNTIEFFINQNNSTECKNTTQTALIFFDLDNFKNINDKYGHSTGDSVLLAISESIKSVMNTNKNAFRYGGDEFILLINNTSKEQTQEKIKMIMDQFKTRIDTIIPKEDSTTLSSGVAFFKKNMTQKEWFKAADDALYQAKKNGKNQFFIAE